MRAPDATLLLREVSRAREGTRDGASGALLRRASSCAVWRANWLACGARTGLREAGEGACAAWKRRPKMVHASRELCCITLTSSCGEGNHAGAEDSLLKSTGGSPWRPSGVEVVRPNPLARWGGAMASYRGSSSGCAGGSVGALDGKRLALSSVEAPSWSNM